MNSGLTERDIGTIHDIFSTYPSITSVYLFGSRAKGTYKKGSDIDLAIMNTGVSNKTMTQLKNDFEESSLPYLVDIVNYIQLTNVDMKQHIDRAGVVFYERVISQ